MASIDVTRNQLKHVSAATIHLKNTKSKIGAKVRNLSYKLLRPKSKLEAVSAAEEKAKSIELQAVKSSEALTLEKLKILRENAMKDRISNNKLREQLVFDTLRGDWMVAFGIWEFDPLKLSNPFPDNRISAHIWQGYENKVVASKIQRRAFHAKQQQLSMRNLQCASSTPTIFTARAPQGSRVTAFWGEVLDVGVIATDEVSRPLSPEAAKEEADSPHPSDEVVREKHRCLFTEKKVCPPISLLGYTWVEEECPCQYDEYAKEYLNNEELLDLAFLENLLLVVSLPNQ
ncbi:hypothetical protein JHK82_050269 [Glycine max]|nr:hypothetical protein JHK82_050269 [Glycine max]